MEYDASCIKVLPEVVVEDKFEWVRIENLATKYLRPVEWIANGFEACRRCNIDPEYFIKYYLEKDKSIVFIPEVEQVYRDIKLEL
jgi:hypothetical protein